MGGGQCRSVVVVAGPADADGGSAHAVCCAAAAAASTTTTVVKLPKPTLATLILLLLLLSPPPQQVYHHWRMKHCEVLHTTRALALMVHLIVPADKLAERGGVPVGPLAKGGRGSQQKDSDGLTRISKRRSNKGTTLLCGRYILGRRRGTRASASLCCASAVRSDAFLPSLLYAHVQYVRTYPTVVVVSPVARMDSFP